MVKGQKMMTPLEQLQSDFERADKYWAELQHQTSLDIRAIRSAVLDMRRALAAILALGGKPNDIGRPRPEFQ